jgi:hypothetical protein
MEGVVKPATRQIAKARAINIIEIGGGTPELNKASLFIPISDGLMVGMNLAKYNEIPQLLSFFYIILQLNVWALSGN